MVKIDVDVEFGFHWEGKLVVENMDPDNYGPNPYIIHTVSKPSRTAYSYIYL